MKGAPMIGNAVAIGCPGPLIHEIRGTNVILDADLVAAVVMETRNFGQAVKRHEDLIDSRHRFQLTFQEFAALRSQSVTSKPGRGGRTHLPWAFTERGVARVPRSVIPSLRRSAAAWSFNDSAHISGLNIKAGPWLSSLHLRKKCTVTEIPFQQTGRPCRSADCSWPDA
jgi:hypothetical protein